jgi:predicted phosphohydrolase
MNAAGGDGVLLVGDTAAFDGDTLERCLDLIKIAGPKLFVAGNHELWTHGSDSHEIYTRLLPDRIRAAGWHWLEDEPFHVNDTTIVGSVGWYDYSFAQADLGIPDRFYAAKVSPGAAERLSDYAHLFPVGYPLPAEASDVVARWNDGRFVKLHRPDEMFLDELLARLRGQLDAAKGRRVIAAVHHLPFRELLPPPHSAQWDFA